VMEAFKECMLELAELRNSCLYPLVAFLKIFFEGGIVYNELLNGNNVSTYVPKTVGVGAMGTEPHSTAKPVSALLTRLHLGINFSDTETLFLCPSMQSKKRVSFMADTASALPDVFLFGMLGKARTHWIFALLLPMVASFMFPRTLQGTWTSVLRFTVFRT